jgi:hypothetical protein
MDKVSKYKSFKRSELVNASEAWTLTKAKEKALNTLQREQRNPVSFHGGARE